MHMTQSTNQFHDRLKIAMGDLTLRRLGEITDTHPETVRRYMNGHTPSTVFIANLCSNLGISGEWLLSGKDPMMAKDVPLHAIKNADPDQLMLAVSELVLNLVERVERTEQLMQSRQGVEFKLKTPA